MSEKSVFGDGEWFASTLGHFVGLLVDGGDDAVLYRHEYSTEPDHNGRYCETLVVVLLPNGHITKALGQCPQDEIGVHKTLKMMLEQGVMK